MAAGGEAARILPGLQGLDDLAGRHSHTPERAPQGPGRPGCLRREVKERIRPHVRTVGSIYMKFKHKRCSVVQKLKLLLG